MPIQKIMIRKHNQKIKALQNKSKNPKQKANKRNKM